MLGLDSHFVHVPFVFYAALGVDVDVWPPYLSNLVFELWEMKKPPPPPRTKMNSSSSSSKKHGAGGGGGGAKQESGSAAATDAGPFVVRVLYNKEPVALVELPNGGEGDGRHRSGGAGAGVGGGAQVEREMSVDAQGVEGMDANCDVV